MRIESAYRTTVGLVLGGALLCVAAPVAAGNEPVAQSAEADVFALDASDPVAEMIDQQETSWQSEFALLAQALREAYPGTFTDARINSDQLSGTINFSGAVPGSAEILARGLKGVRFAGDRGYTEFDVDGASLELLKSASEALGPDFEATTYFDSVDDSFHVEFVAADPDTVDDAVGGRRSSELTDEISMDGLDGSVDIPIVVEYIAEPVGDTSEAWTAGYALYRSGAYHCSTAFPIKRTSGQEIGVLTAGHCSANVTYGSTTNSIFIGPQAYSQATTDVYPGGDFRWLWSSQMFSGQTQVNSSGAVRTFTSAAIAPFNGTACKFGNTTGYGCGTVTISGVYQSVTVVPEDGGGTYYSGPFHGVGTHITSPGDSGGPWFLNSVGYGIHHGTTPSGGSVWSHLTNALTRFGLQLWKG